MTSYPKWESDRPYARCEYVVLDGQLYQAADLVVTTRPEPSETGGRMPWAWLGQYVPL